MVKDLLTNKEKLLELENTPLNENYSVVLLKSYLKNLETLGVDYDVDPRVPFILGRPFLRTTHALVDVHIEGLTLRVSDEKLVFNIESTSKYPRKHGDESIHKIDILDITCEDHFHEGDIHLIEELLNNEILNDLPPPLPVCVINENEKIKSSINDPSDLELKDLPPHLEKIPPSPVLMEHFDLCNASGTFQRCMVAIFHNMIEKTMEVFMDDFSVFGDSISFNRSSYPCAPDWDLPFEIMCDASDFAVGAVLGQRKDKYFRPIHYASKTLSDAQMHYTTMEKELLVVVYAFEKFQSYLVLSKTIVYTNHLALKYLFSKQDAKPRLLWWVLLLQEFNIEIRDKKRAKNLTADHLSRLENPYQGDRVGMEINDNFPHETLNMISLNPDNEPSWFANIANYLVGNVLVKGMSSQQKKKFFKDVRHYF
ncbi:reverse transcriptase domain-containing protein [Tanacetum coccineum]